MKRIVFATSAFMLSTMVLLVIAELTLRACYDDPVILGRLYEPNDMLSFCHRKGADVRGVRLEYDVHYYTDPRFGLRVATPATPVDAADAIVFGDSFTFGQGVEAEQCFAELVGEHLGMGVLNAGVADYGPDQCYVLAKRLRRSFGAPIEIACFTEVNDYSDFDRRNLLDFSGDQIKVHPARARYRGSHVDRSMLRIPFHGLISRSYLYACARNEYHSWIVNTSDSVVELAHDEERDQQQPDLERIGKLVRMYRSWQDEVGDDRFCVVVLPFTTFTLTITPRTRQLVEALELAGVNVIDLVTRYPIDDERQRLFESCIYPIDRHYCPRGHEYVAERIAQRVEGVLRARAYR